jgi:hypothetical protein
MQALGELPGRDDEPGKMQINLDAAEPEKTNRAALHMRPKPTAEKTLARLDLQSHFGRRVRGNEQPHREHGRFVKAVTLEKILRTQFGAIRQQRDAEKFFLPGEVDRILEELRPVAVPAKGIVHDQIFQKEDEAAFRGADGEEKIDHTDDRAVAAQHENAPAIRLFEDQAQTLELLLFVRAEIFFFAEKLTEQIGQLVQIFKNCGFDDDFAHGVASLFHKVRAVAMRDILLFLLLIVILLLILSRIRVPRKDHEQDQDHEQETIDRAGLARKVAALQLPPV